MTDAVRFSVDRATREVLEQFSDTLDREPNWVREFQTTFRKEQENAQDVAQKQSRQVLDRLAEANTVQAMLTTQIDSLQRDLTEARKQQAVTAADLSNRLGAVQTALTAITGTVDSQQEQIKTLVAAIEKISRPWWKKIFGG